MMRNMKLSSKLLSAFFLVAFIAVIVGAVGYAGMTSLSRENEEMYIYNTKPMTSLAVMYDTLASQRICANNMVIFLTADPEFSKDEADSLLEKEELFDSTFKEYKNYLSDDYEKVLYASMEQLYYNEFSQIKEDVRDAVASGNTDDMAASIKALDDMGASISGYMDEAFAINDRLASEQVEASKALGVRSSLIQGAVMLVGVVLSIFLALSLSSIIVKPLRHILTAAKQVGERGDLNLSEKLLQDIDSGSKYRDEIGQVSRSFSVMIKALMEKTQVLEVVAAGDLTPEITLVSGEDTIGNALIKMLNNLNKMFNNINSASSQVATGSKQISDVSQGLAQGATEQAVAVENLSRSISDVAGQTKNNAEMATQAAELSDTIKENAKKGSAQMDLMIKAVGEISDASQSIHKVINAIDDIAFQTNILALNAAVEAARAGQHGKGFAVVAEEVRNLAQKSANSAKTTSDLIANSIEKTDLGVKIASETSYSLNEIVTGISENSRIVSAIAQSCDEQSAAVLEINTGINQVAQVVQHNSATAEESAAASEEMNSQASLLENLVAQFKLKKAAGKSPLPVMREAPALPSSENDNRFGKY